MLVIPAWVDSEQWLYKNMPSKNSQYYGTTTRQRGRIIRDGLSGLGVVVNPEVDEVLSQVPVYAEATSKNAQLSQRIAVLDQNIVQWKAAKVLEKDRVAALKTLNAQRSQAVSDQAKLRGVLAKLMVEAGQDVKDQSSGDAKADAANKVALAAQQKDLSKRLSLLQQARASAVAEVDPVELPGTLSKLDAQINEVKSRIRASGGTISGLDMNYWYQNYPTDYPVYVNGLSGLEKSFVSKASKAVKKGYKDVAKAVRSVTTKLPGAKWASKNAAILSVIALGPLGPLIVSQTGTRKQKKSARKVLKVAVIVAAVVAAVVLAPIVLPSLAAAASAAAGAVGAAGAAIGAGAAAAGGAIAAGAGTAAAFVGAHALATGAVVAGGAALAMGKKKKKKPGQTAPLPGEKKEDYEADVVWDKPPVAPLIENTNPVTGGGPGPIDNGPVSSDSSSDTSDTGAPSAAPYIAPASSYSGGGGGSGGGPGPIDSGETTLQAYGDGSAVAVSETKTDTPKSNTMKYLLAVGGLAAVGGLTYWYMTRK